MFEVAQKTVTPLKQIYDWSITELFFYATYLVEDNQKQLRDLRKIRNSH